MAIRIKGVDHDMVHEACERLGISRPTLLKYIKEGFFSEPPRHKQGRDKVVRYFPDSWYEENEPRLEGDAATNARVSKPAAGAR
jgi:predicted site-specific integrase-resolvase